MPSFGGNCLAHGSCGQSACVIHQAPVAVKVIRSCQRRKHYLLSGGWLSLLSEVIFIYIGKASNISSSQLSFICPQINQDNAKTT